MRFFLKTSSSFTLGLISWRTLKFVVNLPTTIKAWYPKFKSELFGDGSL